MRLHAFADAEKACGPVRVRTSLLHTRGLRVDRENRYKRHPAASKRICQCFVVVLHGRLICFTLCSELSDEIARGPEIYLYPDIATRLPLVTSHRY